MIVITIRTEHENFLAKYILALKLRDLELNGDPKRITELWQLSITAVN